MQTGKCPFCSSDVIVGDESCEGDILDCANCDGQLEITHLNPLQLKELEEDEQ